MIYVNTPATTANLGAGFDCLGMALTLYNEVVAEEADGLTIEVNGEGAGDLPRDETNLVWRAAQRVFEQVGRWPAGARLRLFNGIPLESGLGSSAAASVAGLLVGNALLGDPLEPAAILDLAVAMEGHPDNVAPALLGGVVAAARADHGELLVEAVTTPPLEAVVVLPDFRLPTRIAREALPPQVAHRDAVFNLGHLALTLLALQRADYPRLAEVMLDRLHQPYRAPLVPGLAQALHAGCRLGVAVTISGAGPAVIALTAERQQEVADALQTAFAEAGCASRVWFLRTAAGATYHQGASATG
ncbi:MAG: homoserine kinase [Anaerolineae bacterium]|nr:homoserine kinase [Anaerolineae bacterium]